MAQRFGACLWPRARSWRPGIESHIGLPVHGACFSLCLCLCLSLSVTIIHKKKKKNLKLEIRHPQVGHLEENFIKELFTKALVEFRKATRSAQMLKCFPPLGQRGERLSKPRVTVVLGRVLGRSWAFSRAASRRQLGRVGCRE